MSDYDEVRDELASIGVSESDYWLMRNWITADPDYITSDLLMEVSDIAREPVADRSLPAAFLAEGRHLVKSPLLTVSLACVAACALLLGRKRVLAHGCPVSWRGLCGLRALSVHGSFASSCRVFHVASFSAAMSRRVSHH